MKICRLPAEVIVKLRSGIAVTNVAHCVEELASNSIDAGATCIAVRLNLPYYKIQVVDNGEGISLDQIDLIGERYATSKCTSLKDLQSIKSGGFRGEALASLKDISSVMVVESRHKASKETYCKIFTQGKTKGAQKCVVSRASKGTTVTIHDFLYNMPVRKKCISEALDLEECCKSLEKLALIYPHISFSLRNDATGEICLETKKCNSVLMAFTYLFGREKSQHMKEIYFAEDKYEILGFVSLEGHVSKDLQLLFVNKRFIYRCKLHKMINAMLNRILFTKQRTTVKPIVSSTDSSPKTQVRYGMFIVNISCPYDQCDITFVPRKTVVVFSQEEKVVHLIEQAIFNFFKSNNLLPVSDINEEQCANINTSLDDIKSMFPLDVGSDINVLNMKKVLLSLPAKRLAKDRKKCEECYLPKKKICLEDEPVTSIGEEISEKCVSEMALNKSGIDSNQKNCTSVNKVPSKMPSIPMTNKRKNTQSWKVEAKKNHETDMPKRSVFPNSNPIMLLANFKHPLDELPQSSKIENPVNFLKQYQYQRLRHVRHHKTKNFKYKAYSLQNEEVSKYFDNANTHNDNTFKQKKISRFIFGDTPSLKILKSLKIQSKDFSQRNKQNVESQTNGKLMGDSLNKKQSNSSSLNSYSKLGERTSEKEILYKEINNNNLALSDFDAGNSLKKISAPMEDFNRVQESKWVPFPPKTNRFNPSSQESIPLDIPTVQKKTKSNYSSSKLLQTKGISKLSEQYINSSNNHTHGSDKICQTTDQPEVTCSYSPQKSADYISFKKVYRTYNSNEGLKLLSSFEGCNDNVILDDSKKGKKADKIVNLAVHAIKEVIPVKNMSHDAKCKSISLQAKNKREKKIAMQNAAGSHELISVMHSVHQPFSSCKETDKQKQVYVTKNCVHSGLIDISQTEQQESQTFVCRSFGKVKTASISPIHPALFKDMLNKNSVVQKELYHINSENNDNDTYEHLQVLTRANDQSEWAEATNVTYHNNINESDRIDFGINKPEKSVFVVSPLLNDEISHSEKSSVDCAFVEKPTNETVANSDIIISNDSHLSSHDERIASEQESMKRNSEYEVKDDLEMTCIKRISGHCMEQYEIKDISANTSENHSEVVHQINARELNMSVNSQESHISGVRSEVNHEISANETISSLKLCHDVLMEGSSDVIDSNLNSIKPTSVAINSSLVEYPDLVPEHYGVKCDSILLKKVDEKHSEVSIERWNIKTDPITERTVFIDKISGNSSFVLPEVSPNNLFSRSEERSKGSSHTSHFFLTHNASPFMARPISLRKQASKCMSSVESSVESRLKDHVEEQEASSMYVKWNGFLPDMMGNVVQDLFSNWENPMFQKSQMDVAYNVGSSQSQKTMYNILNLYRFSKKVFSNLKVIGQVDNKFIACIVQDINESCTGKKLLVLFDQHAVHERIRLEKLMEELYETDTSGGKRVKSCIISPPFNIKVNPKEARLLHSYHNHLQQFGITLTPQNDKEVFEVHSVPLCLLDRVNGELKRKRDIDMTNIIENLIQEWLMQLEQTRSVSSLLPKSLVGVVNSQACHGAIKFGDALDKMQCVKLMESLSLCNLPFQCAHGRPSLAPILDIQKIAFSRKKAKPQFWKLTATKDEKVR